MIVPIAFLIIGVIVGRVIPNIPFIGNSDQYILVALAVVVFCAGIDVGAKKVVFQKLMLYKAKILLIPLGVAIGSILGGLVAGVILNIPPNQSSAIAAGFGYYSISVGIFANLGASHLSALAFLSNIMREFLSLIITPLVAKVFGKLPAVAPGGATAMDVTLPVIAKATDDETTVIALISGIVLTLVVPILIPILYKMGG